MGKQLAALCRAGGHTRQQRIRDFGISGRVIAYNQIEAKYSPATFLVDLDGAPALSAGESSGVKTAYTCMARSQLSTRLERRLRQIENLDPKTKQQVLAFFNTTLAVEEVKRATAE